MTHTPETLKAAEDFAEQTGSTDYTTVSESSFLAGYDYRQKEVDALYRHLKDTTRILASYNQDDQRVIYNNELIQNKL